MRLSHIKNKARIETPLTHFSLWHADRFQNINDQHVLLRPIAYSFSFLLVAENEICVKTNKKRCWRQIEHLRNIQFHLKTGGQIVRPAKWNSKQALLVAVRERKSWSYDSHCHLSRQSKWLLVSRCCARRLAIHPTVKDGGLYLNVMRRVMMP